MLLNSLSMLWSQPPQPNLHDVMRLLKTLTEKVDKMPLDFAPIDADIASLKQQVAQAVALIQESAANSASAAADAAALAQRDADIKALRDQLAAVLAPAAPVEAPVAA